MFCYAVFLRGLLPEKLLFSCLFEDKRRFRLYSGRTGGFPVETNPFSGVKGGNAGHRSDLPIAHAYLDTLVATGAEPVVQSKWLSTVVVTSKDSTVADRLKNLTMVDSVKWVWKGHDVTPATGR